MTTHAGLYGPEALLDAAGRPRRLTNVVVYQADGTTPAVLYTDRTKSTQLTSNAVQTTDDALLSFYAAPGMYVIRWVTAGTTHTATVEVPVDYEDAGSGPGSAVSSVFGRTGDVTLTKADVVATGLAAADVGAATTAAVTSEQARAQGVEATKADLVGGVVPLAQIPPAAFELVQNVATVSAMLALSVGGKGALVRVADDGDGSPALFLLPAGADPTNESHWVEVSMDAEGAAAAALASAQSYTNSAVASRQPLDSDLTAIAALDATSAGTLATDGAGWIKKTYAQLKAALGITTSDVSGLGSAATHAATDFDTSGAATSAVATHVAATDPHADRAYTDAKVAALVNSAPSILDTLGEIAAQLQSDESAATALATTVAGKQNVVVHGSTASTARPGGATVVHWIGSVAPTNATTNDEWTDTTVPVVKRWTGSAWVSLTGASLTTGRNATTHVFDVLGYGAKADAVTRSDGAMTTGSAVLTSAGAAFTSADVGKVVVVNNAKGAGVHLYGTISGYTSATQVTLSTSCTNTVSGAPFSYGTDDTTAIQAAITDATAARGTVQLAPTPSLITSALTVSNGCTIKGVGVSGMFGLDTVTGATTGDLSGQLIPTVAPYLDGSVLVVGAANVNAVTLNPAGNTVNIADVGIYFAGWFKNTGHGIEITASALAGPAAGFNNGGMSHKWDNLYVYGHDGSHYAYVILNTLEQVCTNLNSFGGGGVKLIADSSIAFYGAALINKLKVVPVAGPAHGVYATANNSSLMNVVQLNQYSAISAGVYVGSRYSAWGTLTAIGDPLHLDSGKATNFALLNADIEYGAMVFAAGSSVYISPDSVVTAVSGATDTSAYSWQKSHRRVNADASQSFDANETAGSSWWLVNDLVNGANWAVTTDGTVQFLKPGTARHTGKSPSASVGAALGTTPPPVIISGADSAGRAIFGSGTTPTTGAVASFTFAKTMTLGAVVNVIPLNAATQALGLYVSALSTTGFTVSCANAPSASQAVNIYAFSWTAEDAAAAPVSPIVYDSFDKTDDATTVGSPQIGSAPTAVHGVWGISSNQAYTVSGSGDNLLTWDAGAGHADATISAKIATVAAVGLAARVSDATHFIFAKANTGELWVNNGGAFTLLGTGTTFSNGDTMSIVTSGTSVVLKKNGVTTVSATSSVNSTVTKHGFYSANATAARWDNLSIS